MRLIDADELKEQFAWSEVCRLSIKEITRIINNAPTITPCEEPKNDIHSCCYCKHLICRDDKHETGFCEKFNMSRKYHYPCIHEEE